MSYDIDGPVLYYRTVRSLRARDSRVQAGWRQAVHIYGEAELCYSFDERSWRQVEHIFWTQLVKSQVPLINGHRAAACVASYQVD